MTKDFIFEKQARMVWTTIWNFSIRAIFAIIASTVLLNCGIEKKPTKDKNAVELKVIKTLVLRHDTKVNHAKFSPTDDKVVTVPENKGAKIWDAFSGEEYFAISYPFTWTAASDWTAYSYDGKKIATGFNAGIKIWDIENKKLLKEIITGQSQGSVAFSRDNTKVITSSETVKIYDVSTGNEVFSLNADEGVTVLGGETLGHFSPDGTTIATSSSNLLKTWNAASGQKLLEKSIAEGYHSRIIFSPDNLRLAFISRWLGKIIIFNINSGAQLLEIKGWNNANIFSRDGKKILAAAAIPGPVIISDVESGKELLRLDSSTQKISTAVFSNDGKLVVTASEDNSAQIWDALSGKKLLTLMHDGVVTSALFSHDDNKIITASADKTARIWFLQR